MPHSIADQGIFQEAICEYQVSVSSHLLFSWNHDGDFEMKEFIADYGKKHISDSIVGMERKFFLFFRLEHSGCSASTACVSYTDVHSSASEWSFVHQWSLWEVFSALSHLLAVEFSSWKK